MNNREERERAFIDKCKSRFGEKYDYSLVKYINNRIRVDIICDIHGVVSVIPGYFVNKGCPLCGMDSIGKSLRLGKDEFIKRSRAIHGDKYDYSLVEYKNNSTKIKIICPIHGLFEQLPSSHLEGKECYKCGMNKVGDKRRLPFERVLNMAMSVHKNKYDYSKFIFKSVDKKGIITCDIHGDFEQDMYHHIKRKQGCPLCAPKSIMEERFTTFLNNRKIKYEKEKIFDNLLGVGGKNLRYDFYLKEYNILIELDGRQHYDKSSKYYNEVCVCNDKIKDNFAAKNCFKLIRVKSDSFENFIKTFDEVLL